MRAVRALVFIAAFVVFVAATVRTARGQSCDGLSPDEARAQTARITGELEREERRVRTWSVAWGIGYAAAAAGQAGAALIIDDEDRQADLYVGSGKAAIASLAVVVLPVRVSTPPPPTGDACRDLAAANAALAETAASQAKGRGWFKYVGGLVVSGAGVAIAGSQHGDWLRASLLAGVGFGVTQIQRWTQPDGARDLERSISVVPVVSPDTAMLMITGEL